MINTVVLLIYSLDTRLFTSRFTDRTIILYDNTINIQ